ncbi:FecR family protein [Olivibacter sitiensis]|uniref:FecR family protein n=1 Tax=Olivibacter sitiensis TaxID=376470 RepID=UPI000411682D|nr:FecR family protein [Olivibacter sitiensis]
MKNKDNIERVFHRYLEGNCNEEEEHLLFNYFLISDEKALRNLIGDKLGEMNLDDGDATYSERVRLKRVSAKIKDRIGKMDEELKAGEKYLHNLWRWNLAAAITIVFCFSVVYYGYIYHQDGSHLSSVNQRPSITFSSPELIQKGAVLLINGESLELDKNIGGIEVTPNGIQDESGNSIFLGAMDKANIELKVAKGAQYRIKLSDGTKIWMNSFSSLSFPGAFNTEERSVKLEGEAYFEVTKRGDRPNGERVPFVVQSSTQQVTVLGTKFDVKAYNDESAIRTTLVEGSVKVFSKISSDSVLLVPNKESYVYTDGKVKVRSADLVEALAWKHREFKFNGEDIYHVMRKVARHYDIEVIYADNVSKEKFVGVLSQEEELSELLNMLSSIGNVQFKIDGKTVFVSSNKVG